MWCRPAGAAQRQADQLIQRGRGREEPGMSTRSAGNCVVGGLGCFVLYLWLRVLRVRVKKEAKATVIFYSCLRQRQFLYQI